MAAHSISDIRADVRKAIDEIGINDANFLLGSDQSNLDAIIDSKIEDAIRHIYLVADEQFLEPSAKAGSKDPSTEDGVTTIQVDVPSGFLRLVRATCSNWKHGATEYIPESDSRFPMLYNKYASGTASRPRLAMRGKYDQVTHKTSKVFEFFGAGAGNTQSYVIYYVAIPSKTNDDKYDIYSMCYRPVVYYIAGLVLLTYKDEHADSLLNIALTEVGANAQQNQ